MPLELEKLSREDLNLLSKLAEQSERFEEMVKYMKRVTEIEPVLSVEERNLLSVAFKNIIGTRRVSWRIVSSIEKKEQEKQNEQVLEKISEYRQQIEGELRQICDDILKILDDRLIPAATDGESRVFYAKMKGDYHRYLAEFLSEEHRRGTADLALESYRQASEIAVSDLAPTHPIRLGLALNFSVFYYEILQQPAAACHLAKQAFNEAIPELDMLSEESYKDSTLIMQLLRDNLTLWTSDMQSEDGDSPSEEEREE